MQIHEVRRTLQFNGFRIPVTEVRGVPKSTSLNSIAKELANTIKRAKKVKIV